MESNSYSDSPFHFLISSKLVNISEASFGFSILFPKMESRASLVISISSRRLRLFVVFHCPSGTGLSLLPKSTSITSILIGHSLHVGADHLPDNCVRPGFPSTRVKADLYRGVTAAA